MINKIWKVLKDFQLVNEHNDQIVLLGLRRLISTIADFGFAILCSVLLGNVVVGLIFEIAYMILRIYAGGYHADVYDLHKYINKYTMYFLFITAKSINSFNHIYFGDYIDYDSAS